MKTTPKKTNWQFIFRDLPEIPEAKRYRKGESYTYEQNISLNLINKHEISDEEIEIMKSLTFFYETLFDKLENLNYSSFTKKDFLDFKNYILYAYNYTVLFANEVEIPQLYRVVINKQITGLTESLTKKGYLTYPPLHLIKKKNKYNRANTPSSTLFYGSETINTALNEIKPVIGDIVTIGIWEPNRSGTFICYPISHSKEAYGINIFSTKAMNAFHQLKENQDKTLVNYMDSYFKILGREFTKPIQHHYEYLISSMFSEKILLNTQCRNTPFDFECIFYPSVGNKYKTSNFAFRRDSFRYNFDLIKAIEFEVTKTNYEFNQVGTSDSINLVEFKNFKQSKNIIENIIEW